MTVYMVTYGNYSDQSVEGLFSTREKAEAYIAEARKTRVHDEFNDIEEFELDAEAGKVAARLYTVTLWLDTGEALGGSRSRDEMLSPSRACVVRNGADYRDREWLTVDSPVSADHALKVAAEKRQEWLRTKAIAPG